jgi:N-acetylmuramoyl-L-alanine amidase
MEASPIEHVRIAGKEYARLSDWAKSNEFGLRWLKRDETVELSNSSTRIQLQIHSPEAQLNGVEVRLLFPLVAQGETVWISQADLNSTFVPVLAPPRLKRGSALKSICLDPGHGGKDPGNQVGSNQEKKFALLLALELQAQLKRAGWQVTLTRTRDNFIELPTRPEIARNRKADLFLSLHFNSIGQFRQRSRGLLPYSGRRPLDKCWRRGRGRRVVCWQSLQRRKYVFGLPITKGIDPKGFG